jgi:hypothetical protein
MKDTVSYKNLLGMLKTKPGELSLTESFKVRVGEKLSEEKLDTLSRLEKNSSPHRQLRVLRPGMLFSQDIQELRLNVELDHKNKVKAFFYG